LSPDLLHLLRIYMDALLRLAPAPRRMDSLIALCDGSEVTAWDTVVQVVTRPCRGCGKQLPGAGYTYCPANEDGCRAARQYRKKVGAVRPFILAVSISTTGIALTKACPGIIRSPNHFVYRSNCLNPDCQLWNEGNTLYCKSETRACEQAFRRFLRKLLGKCGLTNAADPRQAAYLKQFWREEAGFFRKYGISHELWEPTRVRFGSKV
jgi:hypothetical protein